MAAARITEAANDRNTSNYCAASDVLLELRRVGLDSKEAPMGALGPPDQVARIVREELQQAKIEFDRMADRADCHLHEDVTVYLDGEDSDTLDLAQYGFWPLTAVTSVTVDDGLLSADDYVFYEDGTLRAASPGDRTIMWWPNRGDLYTFTEGRQNCVLVITWGYAATADGAVQAKRGQSLLTASALLERLAITDDARENAVMQGVRRFQLGDVSVTVPDQGPYDPQIKLLRARADRCARTMREAHLTFVSATT